MNVLILGAGRRGIRLAKHLIEENKAVIMVDTDSERCASLASRLDCLAICGNATDLEVLKSAEVDKADVVVAVTDSDEVNLVSCGIVASNYPSVKTIAAIRNIAYIDSEHKHKKILGIDYIVNPQMEASTRLSTILQSGIFSDIITFQDADFILFKSTIKDDDWLLGKSLIDIKKSLNGEYIVIGIKRNNEVFTPSGNTILEKNDELAIMAVDDESETIYTHIKNNRESIRLKNIVILGATGTAKNLLSSLPKKLLSHITLIEKDNERCLTFSEEFPSILTLNEAITDDEIWEDEKLKSSDLFISVTENDELNIITASFAKKIGAKRSIALLRTNPNYLPFASSLDIDIAISTTEATVDAIMKYIRGEGVKTLHSIFSGELEVYEYILSSSFPHLGKSLMDLDLRGKCIIAGIKRNTNESFVPSGSYVFKEGDTVLVSCIHENYAFVTELFR